MISILICDFLANPGLWIAEFGILLEIGGALWIVIAAFRNRKLVEGLDGTWKGSEKLPAVREAIQGQAITEVRGFSLLGVGLAMQFIGGLPIF